jgi:hypothetical protein
MRKFFEPNLSNGGRLLRALGGTGLILAGFAIRPYTDWACVGLVAAGAFALYEAARGWCVMRACGIKTRV